MNYKIGAEYAIKDMDQESCFYSFRHLLAGRRVTVHSIDKFSGVVFILFHAPLPQDYPRLTAAIICNQLPEGAIGILKPGLVPVTDDPIPYDEEDQED